MVLSANVSCSHIISSDSLQMPSKWLEANCLGWSGGDDTHITCSSTVFTYFNFPDSCSFGCWNCMLIKSSFTIFFDHFWILQAWESVHVDLPLLQTSPGHKSWGPALDVPRHAVLPVMLSGRQSPETVWYESKRRLRKTQEAKEQFVTLQELSCVGLTWSTVPVSLKHLISHTTMHLPCHLPYHLLWQWPSGTSQKRPWSLGAKLSWTKCQKAPSFPPLLPPSIRPWWRLWHMLSTQTWQGLESDQVSAYLPPLPSILNQKILTGPVARRSRIVICVKLFDVSGSRLRASEALGR